MFKCDRCGKEFSSQKVLDIHKDKLCSINIDINRIDEIIEDISDIEDEEETEELLSNIDIDLENYSIHDVSRMITAASNGDEDAKIFLINHYSPIIVKTIDTYEQKYELTFSKEDREDLMQAGAIGILKCLDGDNFSRNIFWFIRNEIIDELARLRGLKGRTTFDKGFLTESGERVDTEEIIRRTETDDVDKYDVPYEINYEEFFINQDIMDVMEEVLTKREQTLIELRYFKDQTLEQVGKRLGVTRERVRQLEVKAIKKLARHPKLYSLRVPIASTTLVTYESKIQATEEICDSKLALHNENSINKYEKIIYNEEPREYMTEQYKDCMFLGYYYHDYRYEVFTIKNRRYFALIKCPSQKSALRVIQDILDHPYSDELDVVLDFT